MRTVDLAVTNNGDMSGNVTVGPLNVVPNTPAAVQITYTGAPVGSLQLQGCLGPPGQDSSQRQTFAGPWVGIGSAVSVPLASGTSYIWDLASTGMSAVQVVFTRTSGTGTISGKGQQKR